MIGIGPHALTGHPAQGLRSAFSAAIPRAAPGIGSIARAGEGASPVTETSARLRDRTGGQAGGEKQGDCGRSHGSEAPAALEEVSTISIVAQ